jgi:hypothetical protein
MLIFSVALGIWLVFVFILSVWYHTRRYDELRRSHTEALRRILNDPRVTGHKCTTSECDPYCRYS